MLCSGRQLLYVISKRSLFEVRPRDHLSCLRSLFALPWKFYGTNFFRSVSSSPFAKCHIVQLHSSTFIPHNSAVLQSYPAVVQLHSHTFQFYNYTVTLCSYIFLQSNPVGIDLHSHTLQVDSYVTMRIYIFLQSYTAVTQFSSHYMLLHSSAVITCSYTVLQS